MPSRAPMYVPSAMGSWHSNALTSAVATVAEGPANSPKFESASARAVRPLAASARPQWFGAGSGLCAEPAFGIVEIARFQAHSFLIESKNPVAKVPLCQVTACSERMQALPRSAEPKTRGRAVRAALPNPSIERDVQGLAALAAPHVKR